MKKILCIMVAIAYSTIGFTQGRSSGQDSAYFVVLYRVGASWDTTKGAMDQPHFKEHAAHLQELRKAGVIRIGARYGQTGMIVLKATTEEQARELIDDDDAIRNKLFTAEIFPFDPFYSGCLE